MNDYVKFQNKNKKALQWLRNPNTSLHKLLELAYERGERGFLIKDFVGIEVLVRLNLVVEKSKNFYIISDKGIETLENIRDLIYEREFGSQKRQKS